MSTVHSSLQDRLTSSLQISPVFCPENVADPFDTVTWDLRTAQIKGDKGELIFEQKDCEIPSTWSQLATNVVASKYFFGEQNTPQRETSVRQLIHRVTRTIADWGAEDGYFASKTDADTFYRELTWLCLHQYAAFNSPVWFNVGLFSQYKITGAKCNWAWNPKSQKIEQPDNSYAYPQGSACFIQSVQDNMEDIMELARSEAMLFKFGSGTGTDLSTLRSCREKLSGGGRPSGPLSFMRVYDQIAAVVKSGGKTRRAAKMQSLKVWHPDIMEFVECKLKEEKKAKILMREGYSYDEAYSSTMFQNANLSVRLTDEFMQAVLEGKPWTTKWVTDPAKDGPTYDAREMMEKLARATWECGDPGVQYDTTINRFHTCPASGRINASNPCVTGDTLVATTAGYRRIKDIVGQTVEIVAGDGKPAFVTEVFKTGHKHVYELRTRCGYRLRLTADHRVQTLNRGDVPAAELTRDDVLKLEKPGFGTDFVPPAFGELIGAALGDGCIAHGKDAAGRNEDFFFITLGSQETEVARHLQENISAAKQWLSLTDGRTHRETRTTATSTGCRVGTSMGSFIAKVNEYAVLDTGSAGKRLCDKVFTLDKQSQASILRGLFTMDGTVADYGFKSQYVAVDSTSLELLRQVQLMLLGFGIKAKIYENRRVLGQLTARLPDGKGGYRAYPVQQVHSLRISRRSRVVFEKEIGFLPESEKCEQLVKLNKKGTYADRMTDYVVSLASRGTEDVYDLTEPRTHHFVANGLVVHNCSEYMFVDNSACNLASINLMRFFDEETGIFDTERFQAACRIVFIAQEILVDHGSYPTQRIAENSHKFRPLGLGYANLGSLLMALGLPYDSDEGRGICAAVTAIMHGAANRTSVELSRAMGSFDEYDKNKDSMLKVMQLHWDAVEKIKDTPRYLRDAARKIWDEVISNGRRYGFRNAQATVLAPTGTISFMMDCDTTGIEPDIALVKYKQMAGGGLMKLVNRTVPLALKRLGYAEAEIETIKTYIDTEDTVEGAPDLLPEHLPVFDCAFQAKNGTRSIPWMAHIRMMAAAQPFISGAISKTVNLPKDATEKDISDAYIEGWKMGLKAVAVYRDGSKGAQPLITSVNSSEKAEPQKKEIVTEKVVFKPRRERLPDTRSSITHKFSVAGHEGYLTVGQYPDGRPGELFITMAKEGSTVGGLMDCFGTAISMSLQYGVPLEVYVNKFSHTRFEPQGHTKNPDIRIAKSIVDYIFRWLGITFLNVPGDMDTLTVPQEGMSLSKKYTPELPKPAEVQGSEKTGKKVSSADVSEKAAQGTLSTKTEMTAYGSSSAKKEGLTELKKSSSVKTEEPDGKNASTLFPPGNAARGQESRLTQQLYPHSPRENGQAGRISGSVHDPGNGSSVSKLRVRLTEDATASLAAVIVEEKEEGIPSLATAAAKLFSGFQEDAPSCSNCGSMMVRNGSCYLCHVCGSTSGCS